MIRLSFPLLFQKAFVKEPSGPGTDRRWAPHMHLRMSGRGGREGGAPGRQRQEENKHGAETRQQH